MGNYGCVLAVVHCCKMRTKLASRKIDGKKNKFSNFTHVTLNLRNSAGMQQMRSLHFRYKFQIKKNYLVNKCSDHDLEHINWSKTYRSELITNVNQVLNRLTIAD